MFASVYPYNSNCIVEFVFTMQRKVQKVVHKKVLINRIDGYIYPSYMLASVWYVAHTHGYSNYSKKSLVGHNSDSICRT